MGTTPHPDNEIIVDGNVCAICKKPIEASQVGDLPRTYYHKKQSSLYGGFTFVNTIRAAG